MSQIKKASQLGMPFGTACNRLRKLVLFKLLCELNKNICFQCEATIESADQLSIEHKQPWMDTPSPQELFWDLDNIAFSHLNCNVGAGRKPHQKRFTQEDNRAHWRAQQKRYYTPERRRQKFLKHGY